MDHRRLLAYDNCEDFLNTILDAAKSEGFSAVSATTGHEFKRLFREFAPNLVILEPVMPDFDGVEAIRWLCRQDAEATVIVASERPRLYGQSIEMLAWAHPTLRVVILPKSVGQTGLRQVFRRF